MAVIASGPLTSSRPADAVVITGTPGVGKSTVCRALARRRPTAAHVEADSLHRFLVSGGEWPSAGTERSVEQLVLRTRNAASVASNFTSLAIPTFVDDWISTSRQVRVLGEALPDAVVIVLTATRSQVLQRDAQRDKHTAAMYLDSAETIDDVLGRDAIRIDTTSRTIDDVVSTIEQLLGRSGHSIASLP
jgi:broad-specificity NMP kinase